MKILVVGGGSGGHITPAIAVVRKILEIRPRTRVEFFTDRKYYRNVTKISVENGLNFSVKKIFSGKFHRYSGWGIKDYFEHLDLTIKDLIIGNLVGFFGFLGGLVQSFFLLLNKRERPDVIFLKGGYVGLPVGIVAKMFRISYVIHESDSVPGLANRILMKGAKVVAMGVSYEKTEQIPNNWEWVGIPIAEEFKKVSEGKKRELKKIFGFAEGKPLVVVTGGSQGSENLDRATKEILPELLKIVSVGLVAGRKHYEEMIELKKFEKWEGSKLMSDFRMWEFNTAMHELLGAADIVVSRAGATTIAELAALGKTVILVPFAALPGAHQVKNAERLVKKNAVVLVDDAKMYEDSNVLLQVISKLVKKPEKMDELASNLHSEVKTGAAKRLAEILIEIGDHEKK